MIDFFFRKSAYIYIEKIANRCEGLGENARKLLIFLSAINSKSFQINLPVQVKYNILGTAEFFENEKKRGSGLS